MKTKLLRKLRKRFKFVMDDGLHVLLDIKSQRIVYPFVDWHLSRKRAHINYALSQILGKEKYMKMRQKHASRKAENKTQYYYNMLLKAQND